jgi:hypothetical protein
LIGVLSALVLYGVLYRVFDTPALVKPHIAEVSHAGPNQVSEAALERRPRQRQAS